MFTCEQYHIVNVLLRTVSHCQCSLVNSITLSMFTCEQYHIDNVQLVDKVILIISQQCHFVPLSLIDKVISSEQNHLTISKN